MTEQELNHLIGLSIVDGIRICEDKGFRVEIWPAEAIIANRFSPKTVRLWHEGGITKGWTMGSPWDMMENIEVPLSDRT
jgi:hypothetical protein